jgi:hypothetical protein
MADDTGRRSEFGWMPLVRSPKGGLASADLLSLQSGAELGSRFTKPWLADAEAGGAPLEAEQPAERGAVLVKHHQAWFPAAVQEL